MAKGGSNQAKIDRIHLPTESIPGRLSPRVIDAATAKLVKMKYMRGSNMYTERALNPVISNSPAEICSRSQKRPVATEA
jgi:hypothetical protein